MDDISTILELFLALSNTLPALRSRDELLPVAAQRARILLQAGRVDVLTLDPTNQFLLHAISDPVQADRAEPLALYSGVSQNTKSAAAHAAFTGRLVKVPNTYAFSGFDFYALYERDRLDRRRTGSFVAFPLRNHDAVTIGVIQAFDVNWLGSAAEPAMERWIKAFAPMVAGALSNLRLIDEKQSLIRRLGRTNEHLEEENARLKSRVNATRPFPEIAGESSAMLGMFRLVARTLDTNVTVLLTGETGTGKEVIAQAIHRNSSRSSSPFIVQNCAAVPEQLLESELFGHRRGAFTGATENKPGLFQAANGGTLFLDEIGDMPMSLQAKILRVLQDSEVRAIGDTRSHKVDVRIIAATHRDLRERVREGYFREDLYYRICVFPITMPPLRERRSDILLLADHFLKQIATRHGRRRPAISNPAAELLERYDYPGNVRELKNAIERAVLLIDGNGAICPDHLPAEFAHRSTPSMRLPGPLPPDVEGLRNIVQRYEAIVLSSMLEDHGWNQTRTAEVLHISRRSLVEKIQRYAIRRNGDRCPT